MRRAGAAGRNGDGPGQGRAGLRAPRPGRRARIAGLLRRGHYRCDLPVHLLPGRLPCGDEPPAGHAAAPGRGCGPGRLRGDKRGPRAGHNGEGARVPQRLEPRTRAGRSSLAARRISRLCGGATTSTRGRSSGSRGEPTVTPGIAGSERGVAALLRDIAVKYEVLHAAPVYLLDSEKRMRALHTSPLNPGGRSPRHPTAAEVRWADLKESRLAVLRTPSGRDQRRVLLLEVVLDAVEVGVDYDELVLEVVVDGAGLY